MARTVIYGSDAAQLARLLAALTVARVTHETGWDHEGVEWWVAATDHAAAEAACRAAGIDEEGD